MRIDRPPPGEELNPGEETRPRVAASVILLRDTPDDDAVEVLLVKRNPEARFMGGAWVFPGGAVHDPEETPAGAAVRELEEEAGVVLRSEDELVPFSRWITPTRVKVRFDTWFFVAAAPPDADPVCDGEECVEIRFVTPAAALEAGRRGELFLVFPTIRTLERFAALRSVEEALETARAQPVEPILPRVVERDGAAHVLLPGEPGYDDGPPAAGA